MGNNFSFTLWLSYFCLMRNARARSMLKTGLSSLAAGKRPVLISRGERASAPGGRRRGNGDDRAVRVIEDRVDDRSGTVVRRVPTQHHQIGAGGQPGQRPAGVPVHHVLADRHAGVLRSFASARPGPEETTLRLEVPKVPHLDPGVTCGGNRRDPAGPRAWRPDRRSEARSEVMTKVPGRANQTTLPLRAVRT